MKTPSSKQTLERLRSAHRRRLFGILPRGAAFTDRKKEGSRKVCRSKMREISRED